MPRAVQVLIAESAGVREVLVDGEYLSWEASRYETRGLEEMVRDVVAAASELRQAQRELGEMERKFVDTGERYYGERQHRVNVAAVASRVLLRAHADSHSGPVATCGTCARVWAVVGEASGLDAPGN